MKKKKKRGENGMVAVEATIILPIAILSVLLLLYLSLVMFQKANLQAGLETTLLYYKNSLTDTFVTQNSELEQKKDEKELTEEHFREYFESTAGKLLFDDEMKFSIDYTNYFLFKQIKVTVVQRIKNPVPLLGQMDTFLITATARVNVVDHDGLIRDADFVIDLVEDTKIGEYARGFAEKISGLYDTMKAKLGVE